MDNELEKKGGNGVIIILVILILLSTAIGSFFYYKMNRIEKDPSRISEENIQKIVDKVGKIIDLPEGESPVMATVTDTKPLANNPFFVRAKVGDQVLLYTVAKKAFLYDPNANIILEVASLTIGQ